MPTSQSPCPTCPPLTGGCVGGLLPEQLNSGATQRSRDIPSLHPSGQPSWLFGVLQAFGAAVCSGKKRCVWIPTSNHIHTSNLTLMQFQVHPHFQSHPRIQFDLVSYPDPHPPAILFGRKSGSGYDLTKSLTIHAGFGKDQSDCRIPISCTIVT